jgi:hypothetical protein
MSSLITNLSKMKVKFKNLKQIDSFYEQACVQPTLNEVLQNDENMYLKIKMCRGK